MFGYVTVAKEQLSDDEYDTFRAYYCGVCKATGRRASQAARLGLSYDITFLAIVLSSLFETGGQARREHCIAHHIQLRSCVRSDMAVDYAAEMGVLLTYLKFADDWRDERSIKAFLCMAAFYPAYRRVCRRRKDIARRIRDRLDKLSALERDKCPKIDETADCFAKILRDLFTPEFVENGNDRRALAWLGYNIGRWIYIIDAVNDLEEDKRHGAYNSLAEEGFSTGAECVKSMEPSLTFTLENIASAFELINFRRNKSIIGKMVYTSLKQKQWAIFAQVRGEGGLRDESI